MDAALTNVGAIVAIVVSILTAFGSLYTTVRAARKGVRDADVAEAMQTNTRIELLLKMRDDMIQQLQDDNEGLRKDNTDLRAENRSLRQELQSK